MPSKFYGLPKDDWEILEALLIKPLKSQGVKLWIFGSRAIGAEKKFSDIDILFKTPEGFDYSLIEEIREKVVESRISITMDLVDKNHMAKSYEKNILDQCVLL